MTRSLTFNFLTCVGFTLCAQFTNAEVFMTDAKECYQIKKVENKKIYYADESSKEGSQLKVLDATPSGLRYGEILSKAMKAASDEQNLCGSVRGISVISKSDTADELARDERRRKEVQCSKEREAHKASWGIVGFLNSTQMRELEDVYAKCMTAKNAEKESGAPVQKTKSSVGPTAR